MLAPLRYVGDYDAPAFMSHHHPKDTSLDVRSGWMTKIIAREVDSAGCWHHREPRVDFISAMMTALCRRPWYLAIYSLLRGAHIRSLGDEDWLVTRLPALFKPSSCFCMCWTALQNDCQWSGNFSYFWEGICRERGNDSPDVEV